MKKGGLIALIFGVVLVIVGSIIIFLPGEKKTNKELFTDAVNKSFGFFVSGDEKGASDNEIATTIKEIEKNVQNKIYKLSLTGNFTEGEAGYLNLDSELYYGKGQFYIKTSIDNNDQVYSGESLFQDNKLYFYIKDILNNYYYIDNLTDMIGGSNNTKLIQKVVDYLKDSVSDVIVEEDVKVENEDITINNNTYNTKKYAYTFTGDTLYNIISKFANKIKNDKEIISEINNLLKSSEMFTQYGSYEINQQDFNQIIDVLLEYSKEVKNLGNMLTLSIYMDGDEVISRQLSLNIPSEQGNIPIKIGDYKGKSYYKISASTMGQDIASLEIIGTGNNESKISVKSMGAELITGKYVKTSNGIEITLESPDEDNETKIFIKINNNNTGSIVVAASDESKLTIEYKLEEVNSIPKVDVENALPYTEMTEEDKDVLTRFITLLNPLYYTKSNTKADVVEVNDCYRDEEGFLVCNNM